jgi:hypothetical protein
VNHLDGKRASARKYFGRAGARTQELGELDLRVPELVDRIVEQIYRIEPLVTLDGPASRLTSSLSPSSVPSSAPQQEAISASAAR